MPRFSQWMLAFAVLALAGCGNGKVIGSGPLPTPVPVNPNVSFEYTVPTANAGVWTVIGASNGYLYFTEQAASKIGQLSTGGSFLEVATKSAGEAPTSIIVGPNNALWWTQLNVPSVATMTTGFVTTNIVEYPIPWGGSAPVFLTRGVPDSSMYFTDAGVNAIGEVSTTGVFSGPFTIPTSGANPQGIVTGPDNKMWFTEFNTSKIGVLDPLTNTITEHATAANSHPDYIVVGPDGALWFTEDIAGGAKLGRMTTTYQYSEYPLPGASSATGLTEDLYGDLVITDTANSAIGVFKLGDQSFKEYPTKTASANPLFITVGPDGRLYFTELSANKIGQFSYF